MKLGHALIAVGGLIVSACSDVGHCDWACVTDGEVRSGNYWMQLEGVLTVEGQRVTLVRDDTNRLEFNVREPDGALECLNSISGNEFYSGFDVTREDGLVSGYIGVGDTRCDFFVDSSV